MSESFAVFNPVATKAPNYVPAAKRLGNLNGKTVGLLWNGKPGGDIALNILADMLLKRYPDVKFWRSDWYSYPFTDAQHKIVRDHCDAAITTTGDCGSCTSWLITDTVKIDGAGIPVVALVTEPFMDNARLTAESAGLANLRIGGLRASALSNLNAEEVRAATEPTFEDVLMGLTQDAKIPGEGEPKDTADNVSMETFGGKDGNAAFDAMNKAFIEYGWSDGMPVVPPTEERVNALLATTQRSPDDVIGVLEPGMGRVTVRKIAINAAMAGCLPGHRPIGILIAAVKALCDPRMLYRVLACSTGPHAPMMVINGPIRHEINLNCRGGALGPGAKSYTNTVLGRALRLIMMNCGFAYLGAGDMDTIGSPNKYSMCLGENEEESPWAPYHVDAGLKKTDSAVTVFGVESQLEIFDLQSETPEGLLTTYAGSAPCVGNSSVRYWLYKERIAHNGVLLCPDHAHVFLQHGWTKEDISLYLFKHATLPAKYFINTVEKPRSRLGMHWVFDQDPETPTQIAGAPDWFRVVVTGMAAGKSSYTQGSGEAITVKIED